MALYVTIAFALCVVSVTPLPDAPLYPNNVVFASAPLFRQPIQAAPQFFTQPTNGAYSTNPTVFATQQNQNPAKITPAAASPGTVFNVVSDGAPTVPQNFFTFTRTPAQQSALVPAEQVQSGPRNFVSFTRTPTQQLVQTQAEPVQSVPRNFVTFTRTPLQRGQQQDLRTVLLAANEQPAEFAVRAPAQQQFGQRNVLAPSQESAAQQTGVRTVIFFPAQQARAQTNTQTAENAEAVVSPRPRTVLVARPVQGVEQPQLSGNIQNQPSSSQFFTRNFGNSGAVTYFIHPLLAPAGQAAPLKRPSPDTEI